MSVERKEESEDTVEGERQQHQKNHGGEREGGDRELGKTRSCGSPWKSRFTKEDLKKGGGAGGAGRRRKKIY